MLHSFKNDTKSNICTRNLSFFLNMQRKVNNQPSFKNSNRLFRFQDNEVLLMFENHGFKIGNTVCVALKNSDSRERNIVLSC